VSVTHTLNFATFLEKRLHDIVIVFALSGTVILADMANPSSETPSASNLIRFRLHWSCLSNCHTPFPIETLTPNVQCLVIVSETEGYSYDSGMFHDKHLSGVAKLKNLRDLTLARCSLVPTSDWTTFFESLALNCGQAIECISLPGCNGVDDEVCSHLTASAPVS
jgi:hypothetical protein